MKGPERCVRERESKNTERRIFEKERKSEKGESETKESVRDVR
jgi:hypothetical protein